MQLDSSVPLIHSTCDRPRVCGQVAEAQLARLLGVPIKRFAYSSRDTDASELRAKVRTFVSGLLDDGTMVAKGYHKYTDED